MPAKKIDCFSGKHQFGFLSDSFKKIFDLAAKQIGYLQQKYLLFALYFFCICHDWTTMAQRELNFINHIRMPALEQYAKWPR